MFDSKKKQQAHRSENRSLPFPTRRAGWPEPRVQVPGLLLVEALVGRVRRLGGPPVAHDPAFEAHGVAQVALQDVRLLVGVRK